MSYVYRLGLFPSGELRVSCAWAQASAVLQAPVFSSQVWSTLCCVPRLKCAPGSSMFGTGMLSAQVCLDQVCSRLRYVPVRYSLGSGMSQSGILRAQLCPSQVFSRLRYVPVRYSLVCPGEVCSGLRCVLVMCDWVRYAPISCAPGSGVVSPMPYPGAYVRCALVKHSTDNMAPADVRKSKLQIYFSRMVAKHPAKSALSY